MTDKRLVVTGIVALVFTVPVLVQALRDGNLKLRDPILVELCHRRGVCIAHGGPDRLRPVQRLTQSNTVSFALMRGIPIVGGMGLDVQRH